MFICYGYLFSRSFFFQAEKAVVWAFAACADALTKESCIPQVKYSNNIYLIYIYICLVVLRNVPRVSTDRLRVVGLEHVNNTLVLICLF